MVETARHRWPPAGGGDGRDHFARGFRSRWPDNGWHTALPESPEIVNGFQLSAKTDGGTAVSQCALTMTMARGRARGRLWRPAPRRQRNRTQREGRAVRDEEDRLVQVHGKQLRVAMGELYLPLLSEIGDDNANHYCGKCNNGTGWMQCNSSCGGPSWAVFAGAAQQLGSPAWW